jgi:hypothetical protein
MSQSTNHESEVSHLLAQAKLSLDSAALDQTRAQAMREKLMGAVALPVAQAYTAIATQPSSANTVNVMGSVVGLAGGAVGVSAGADGSSHPLLQRIKQWFQSPEGGVNWARSAVALCVAVAISIVVFQRITPSQSSDFLSSGAPAQTAWADQPFLSLVSQDELQRHQATAQVVAIDVPHMWLASYGVPTPPDHVERAVRVEWLLAANGDKLALRVME